MFKRDGMLISVEKTEASVYRAWVSPSEWLAPQVMHIDGDPANNRADNLGWVTRSENRRHASDTNAKRKSGAPKKSKPVLGRRHGSEEEWVEGYVVLGAGLDHANGVYLPHSYSDGVRYDPPSSAANRLPVLSHVRTTSHRSFKRAGSKNGTLFRWRPAGAMGSAW